MRELSGSVDDRGRPLVQVRIPGRDDDLLVVVDTAFTGELLLSHSDALQWGTLVLDVEADIELGDRSTLTARQGLMTIDWLGTILDITVQVTPDVVFRSARTQRDGDPVGLLGTTLLSQLVMTIDFPQRRVLLQQPD